MAILDTVAETAPGQEDPLLAQIVERLVDSYHPEQIYLFGSVARGDATLDSDYDLMIVVPNHAAPNQCHPDLAYRAVRGLERSGDFLVWTREAFQKRLHIKSSLPATVLREGKLLYASA